MATIRVKAAEGIRFPREGDSKNYITSEPVEVQSTTYYRRALAAGDLVLAENTPDTGDIASPAEPQTDIAAAEPVGVKTTKKVS